MCNKAGDSGLYPSNAEKRAKIEELLEELSAINFLFIPLTRIFGVPEKHGENQKFVDSIQKFAASRLTKVFSRIFHFEQIPSFSSLVFFLANFHLPICYWLFGQIKSSRVSNSFISQ